jgi:exosortase
MRITTRTALALLGLVASFVFLYQDVLYWLVDDWDLNGDYSHGFLVVPIALYLAWERRVALRTAPVRPSAWGFAALLLSMAMVVLGTLAAETTLARLSIIGTLVASIWFGLGSAHVRILRFPLAFLLAMIPIPSLIFNQIAFPLQLVASAFGEVALSAVSIPVLREGNLIVLPNMTLEVAEACSGIRSLVALFTLSLLYGHLCSSRTTVRVVLLMSTIPIAIFVNGVRVAATGLTAHAFGLEFAEGIFHSTSGWAMFVVAGALMVGVKSLAEATSRWLDSPHQRSTAEEPVA